MSRRAQWAIAAFLLTPGLAKAEPAQSPQEHVTTLVCRLLINGTEQPETVVLLETNDVWVPADTLANAGIRWTAATERRAEQDVRFVSLHSLVPRVSYTFDDKDVRLTVSAAPESFAPQDLSAAAMTAAERRRVPAAFFNYSAVSRSGAPLAIATEIGASSGPFSLRSTASTRLGVGTIREATTVTIDDERRLVRWQLGDVFARSEATESVTPIVGISIAREFGIQPAFVQYTPMTLSGATTVPAVAEIYVNDQLVHRAAISPGPFSLRDIPVPIGAGNVRLIIRDDFGRTREISSSFYRSPRVLRPGLREFRYSVGLPRVNPAERSFAYAGFVASADDRVGLNRWMTIGGTAEATTKIATGGATIAVQLPFGAAEMTALASRRQSGESGSGWMASFGHTGARFSVQALARATSPSFAEMTVAANPSFQSMVSASTVLAHGASVSVTETHMRTALGNREQTALSVSVSPLAGANISAGLFRTRDRSQTGFGALATVTVTTGSRSSVNVGAQMAADRRVVPGVSVQRSMPMGPGVGYRVERRDGPLPQTMADVVAQNGLARVEIRHDDGGPAGSTTSSVSGAITFLRGGIHLSRPIDDAFALVTVGDLPGVRTYLSNQYVGRTGRRGTILIPSLLSYYANRVAVDDRDVPMAFEIGRTESIVAPGLRGASVVDFLIQPIRLVSGRFLLPAAIPADLPRTAQAIWPSGVERAEIGQDGTFLFERAVPGRHDVRISVEGAEFTCKLAVPPMSPDVTTVHAVGDVACVAAPSKGSR